MRTFARRTLAACIVAIITASTFSLTSCRDKFITQVDTLVKRDTIIKTLGGDTVVVHDTVDLDDSSVWVYRTSGITNDFISGQFVSATLGFFGGTNGAIIRTSDAGNTWQNLTPVGVSSESGTGVYGIHFFDNSRGVAIGDGYSVWGTSNGGSTWNANTLSTSYNLRSIGFATPTLGFIGTSNAYSSPPGMDGELWQTTDGGSTWKNVRTLSSGAVYDIDFGDALNGFALCRYGATLWTSDGGTTWNPGSTDRPGVSFSRSTFTTPKTALATALLDSTNGYIMRTDDAGRTWRTVQSYPFFVQGITNNGNGVITAAGYFGRIVESTDGGATWTVSRLGTERWLDVKYAGVGRSVIVGIKGHVATRDK